MVMLATWDAMPPNQILDNFTGVFNCDQELCGIAEEDEYFPAGVPRADLEAFLDDFIRLLLTKMTKKYPKMIVSW